MINDDASMCLVKAEQGGIGETLSSSTVSPGKEAWMLRKKVHIKDREEKLSAAENLEPEREDLDCAGKN